MSTIKEDEEKYILNSIRAYLDGTKGETWLIGIAKSVNTESLRKALIHYNDSRLDFLEQLL